jgi:hypothetical protein|tara:strand:+ start:325 stop:753 length:429 start_codon:yes stop_codon:yes gene_type:complete
MNEKIILKDVQPSQEDIRLLYSLLSERRFNISHQNTPSFEEHIKFVKNHPYRAWVIVSMGKITLGNIYIHTDNSIGANIYEEYLEYMPIILKILFQKWKPLPPIPSVRNKNFFINIPQENDKLVTVIQNLGAKHIQSSYLFD